MTPLYVLFVLCAVLCHASADSAADDGFNPVSVSEGPLLFFFLVESAEGKPTSDPNARVDVLYVFDPGSHQEPHRIWQGTDPPLARPIALLRTGVVAFEQGDKGFLLDLESGETTDLLATENQIDVVSVEKGKVFFVDRQRSSPPFPFGGIKLESGKNDETIVKEYFQPRDVLYVLDKSRPDQAKILVDIHVEEILFEDDKCFWVITSGTRGKDRNLCTISKSGTVEEVVPFPNEWMACLTRMKFSPNRQHLALSSAHEMNDFHNERELILIDLEKKEVVFSRPKVKPNLPMFGGAPYISLAWLDDDLLYYGSHALNIKTGKEPSEDRWKRAQVVTAPSDVDQNTIGFFDLRHGEAYFKGDDKPVASVLDKSGTKIRDLAIDEQGEWVAFASPTASEVYLVDGKTREKRLLSTGWSHGINWLPTQMSRYR